ncbi:MAG TPA: hypothetical protein IAD50_06050, partial [Candidatus Egerieisoma faecipullorum]|nr:hypothetical protein [Candidatus Egerieisoma faecipullorum]
MKKKWLSLLLAVVITAAAFPAGLQLHGEGEAEMVERVFVTYEDLEITEEFSADST